ncbi:hypothetical protein QA644_14470 [Rhizobium sp. CC1099]|uniref:hypothetical protein n=1 Tax=Rhizobium sp. CC1099 TaxID=3039160 RepID=UPI0024B19A13|nr:hypothetical protein [Rhizobium sp. CC1099]WFU86333.1 hypothetical protein QA644_14470 [Rhizobium sp. CC1099]
MEVQQYCRLAAFFAGLLVAQSALAGGAHSQRPDESELLDPTCTAVNEADVNTRKGYGYRELVHQPFKGGSTKEYIEIIYRAANEFQRYSGRSTWQKFDIPEVNPYDQRFTSCTFVDSHNGYHYYANWNKPGYRASAEIWLTRDRNKLAKVIRRYPPDRKEFPFSTVISIFDYNAKKAQRPDDALVVAREIPKNDPTCDAVNAAYVKTRQSREFNVSINKVKEDGSLEPYVEGRFTETEGVNIYAHSRRQQRFDRNNWSTVDQHGPKFTDCTFVESTKIGSEPAKYYNARWHRFPYSANSDIWVSDIDGRMMKTLRRYDDPWEFTFQNALEVYNYDPASAVAPPD